MEQGDSGGDICAWLSLYRGGNTVVALPTVDVSLHLHTTPIREDTSDRLLVLAVHPVVGQRSRELSLEAPASKSPHASSSWQVQM